MRQLHAAGAAGAPLAGARVTDRYSRLVDLLRYLLPATALMLIVLVAWWPQLVGSYGGLIAPMLAGDFPAADAMRMHNARYLGRSKSDKPYEVTAASAYLDPIRPNRVHLRSLAADIDTASDHAVRLLALKGVYYREGGRLDLAGGIEMTTSDGYRFETERARVSLTGSRVVGNRPIVGTGPAGTLSADRFEIRDGGDVLRFEGRVKVTLEPYEARS